LIGTIRRSVAVTLAAGVAMASGAALAAEVPLAAPTDLELYLESAAAAEYSGRRIIITLYDGETQAGIYEVTHLSQMAMVGAGGEGSLIGSGRVSGDGAVMIPEWSRYVTNDRYSSGTPVSTMRLGRPAELIEVFEAGRVRARFTFDALTRVPLATEIFDEDGALFRYSAMLEVNLNPDLSYAEMEAMGDSYDVMFPVEVTSLPHDAAGYVRADTYSGPDETVQAFFTDGLFSFSLFELDAGARLDRFEGAAMIQLNGSEYQRLFTPSELWVTWKSGDVVYLLVGDLPPDHLADVLSELPSPSEPGLLNRFWRGIFG
jgi:hypothetical protein